MAFTFKKPAGASSKPVAESKPKKDASAFLKTGDDAKLLMEKREAEIAANKERMNRAWRFRLKEGEDAHITFLDGVLDANTGILAIPFVNEHRVKLGDRYEEVACIEEKEPCPICAEGGFKSLSGLMTILDHRGYEDKDGKKHEVVKRLYPAKTETLKMLTKLAEKNGGSLVGITFEVSRTGEKKASVGDLYEKVAKHSLEDVAETFGGEMAQPLDYSQEVIVLDAEEMVKLGIGKKTTTFGSKSFGKKKGTSADDVDDDKPVW